MRCAQRAGRVDTRASSPPRWCSALDREACSTHFSTTIHGEPRLCHWMDVGCRSGNISMCAEVARPNSTSGPVTVAGEQTQEGSSTTLVLFLAACVLLVSTLVSRWKARAAGKGQQPLVATRGSEGDLLERLSDKEPIGGVAGAELVDFPDDESQITFLPDQDFRILREAGDDEGTEVTFLGVDPTAALAMEEPTAQAQEPPLPRGEDMGDPEVAFTQRHAAQAASRYRLACQLQAKTEASRPAPRGPIRPHGGSASADDIDFDLASASRRQDRAEQAAAAQPQAGRGRGAGPGDGSAPASRQYALD